MRGGPEPASTPSPFCSPGQSQATDPSSLLIPYSRSLYIHVAPTLSLIYTLPPHGHRHPGPRQTIHLEDLQVSSCSIQPTQCSTASRRRSVCLQCLSTELPMQNTREPQAIGLPVISRPLFSFPSLGEGRSWAEASPWQAVHQSPSLRQRPPLGSLWSPKPGPAPSH